MKTRSRAILFRIGGLGDLLVALPAIALVRRSLPGFSLTLAGRPEYGGLLKRAGLVDEVLSFADARMAALFAGGAPDFRADAKGGTEKRGASPLGGFGMALGWLNRRGDWPADDWWARQGVEQTSFISYESGDALPISRFFFDRTRDFLGTSLMRAWISGRVSGARAGVTSPTTRNVSVMTIDASAFDPAAPGPDQLFADCARLPLPGGLKNKSLDDLGLRRLGKNEKRLVVHPGSGGRAKRWPLANFIEVTRTAASLGLAGVLVTGEAEADLEPALQALALPAGWARVSRLPAETLADLLAGSTHYLGNDSGPTHLAAACGASVLALFREDSLPAWRPFGKVRLIAAPSMSDIPLGLVLSALERSSGRTNRLASL